MFINLDFIYLFISLGTYNPSQIQKLLRKWRFLEEISIWAGPGVTNRVCVKDISRGNVMIRLLVYTTVCIILAIDIYISIQGPQRAT